MMKNGYTESICEAGKEGNTWYVPHDGVYHPEKSGKIRVVFDCCAEHNGIALNDLLLHGPDISNKLIDVLVRFRKDFVAVTCKPCFTNCESAN